jgi:hypothetical protein
MKQQLRTLALRLQLSELADDTSACRWVQCADGRTAALEPHPGPRAAAEYQASLVHSVPMPRALSSQHAGPLPPLVAQYSGHHLQPQQGKAYPSVYMNLLVREAVPGKPGAAHCSMQTDLCGNTWPLDQPFPFATVVPHQMLVPYMQHQAHGMLPPQAAHASPGATTAQSNPASNLSSQGHVMLLPGEACTDDGIPPAVALHRGPYPQRAESRALVTGVPSAAAIPPPSPPSSPPPELVDVLFDFDKFDAAGLADGLEESSDLMDLDTVLAMENVESDADFFSLFERDRANGWPVMTTHLHQRPAASNGHACAAQQDAKRSAADQLTEQYGGGKRLCAAPDSDGGTGQTADSSPERLPAAIANSCKQAGSLVKSEAVHGAFTVNL